MSSLARKLQRAKARAKPEHMEAETHVVDPLVIIYENNGKNMFRLHIPEGGEYAEYGLLVCDLVRHIAKAFNVPEAAVWMWVDAERSHPTTDIIQES